MTKWYHPVSTSVILTQTPIYIGMDNFAIEIPTRRSNVPVLVSYQFTG